MNTTLNLSLSLSTDDVSYLLELLNNERYDANTNCRHVESLIATLVAAESVAQTERVEEDAYWTARERALTDDAVMAQEAAIAQETLLSDYDFS